MTLEEKFAQMHMIVQIDKLLDGQTFSPERVEDPRATGLERPTARPSWSRP
jgi:hypothetical protein